MADSTEQKIVTRALAVAAAINGTGGYLTTLGTSVRTGSSAQSLGDSVPNWEQKDMPALSVFQAPVEVEARDDEAQRVLRRMRLIFRGFLQQTTSAATARYFIADIFRAIRAAGDKWQVSGVNLAEYTEEGPHQIVYSEGYEITGVEVEITIFYAGNHLDIEA